MCMLRPMGVGPRTMSMYFNALRFYWRNALIALVVFAGGFSAVPARADCTDAPAPGVDWRRCYQDGRDFAGADLSRAQLRDASFTRADLAKATFDGADAYRAKFYSANMAGVSFAAARVAEADFSEADLTGALFTKADMRGAKLVAADLRGADFKGANLRGADFFRAQLGGALWTDGKTRCAVRSIGQCN